MTRCASSPRLRAKLGLGMDARGETGFGPLSPHHYHELRNRAPCSTARSRPRRKNSAVVGSRRAGRTSADAGVRPIQTARRGIPPKVIGRRAPGRGGCVWSATSSASMTEDGRYRSLPYVPDVAAVKAISRECRMKACVRRRSPVFAAWLAIQTRGRVCRRWRSFPCFYFDVGPRPSWRHLLIRDDTSRPFEPGNVAWRLASRYRWARPTARDSMKPGGAPS
jgi:hypothetical protein